MVYNGPSRGCQTCRKRRVKCDEQRPACGVCIRRKQECPGYRSLFDATHRPEECALIKKPEIEYLKSSNSSHSRAFLHHDSENPYTISTFNPTPDAEIVALCFFFTNYVSIPRDRYCTHYLEHLLPLYLGATPGSSLRLATSAISINLFNMWRLNGADSSVAQLSYARAVTSLRSSLRKLEEPSNDELLCTILILDFYETLTRRMMHKPVDETHVKGALALIKCRGEEGFQSRTSQRLLTAFRSRYVCSTQFYGRKAELNDPLFSGNSAEQCPGEKLDKIIAQLANLRYDSLSVAQKESTPHSSCQFQTATSTLLTFSFEEILIRALDIDDQLHNWQADLPIDWKPHRITSADQIHCSIRTAGIYNDLCDVYSSLAPAKTLNTYRTTHISTLRLIRHCLHHLDRTSIYYNLLSPASIDTQIQFLIDDICASVPFHLGSRTDYSLPDEPHLYPPVPVSLRAEATFFDALGMPTQMTDHDHARQAAASGGWLLMLSLGTLLNMVIEVQTDNDYNDTSSGPNLPPITTLRPGQVGWIAAQMKRIRKIYLILDPPPPPVSAAGRGFVSV